MRNRLFVILLVIMMLWNLERFYYTAALNTALLEVSMSQPLDPTEQSFGRIGKTFEGICSRTGETFGCFMEAYFDHLASPSESPPAVVCDEHSMIVTLSHGRKITRPDLGERSYEFLTANCSAGDGVYVEWARVRANSGDFEGAAELLAPIVDKWLSPEATSLDTRTLRFLQDMVSVYYLIGEGLASGSQEIILWPYEHISRLNDRMGVVDTDLNFWIGSRYLGRGDIESGMHYLTKVSAANPNYPGLQQQLELSSIIILIEEIEEKINAGHYLEAKQLLDPEVGEYLALESKDLDRMFINRMQRMTSFYYQIGNGLFEDDLKTALDAYEYASRLNDRLGAVDTGLNYLIGKMYRELSEHDKALEYLEKVAEIDPDYPGLQDQLELLAEDE